MLSQLWALVIRQAQLVKGNVAQYISAWVACLMVGSIFGSVYYNMKLDADGGFKRGGAIFSALLFNGMVTSSLVSTYS